VSPWDEGPAVSLRDMVGYARFRLGLGLPWAWRRLVCVVRGHAWTVRVVSDSPVRGPLGGVVRWQGREHRCTRCGHVVSMLIPPWYAKDA